MRDYEGAKTMLVGVQVTLLALFVPDWIPGGFTAFVALFGTALVVSGYRLE